jgi:hypothetical protein
MNAKIEIGTLARVHNARHQISEKFNHEPEKLIRYYIELQKNYKIRFADSKENQELKKAV